VGSSLWEKQAKCACGELMKIRRVREIEQPEIGDSTAFGFDRGLVHQKAPSILQTNKKTVEMNKIFSPALSNKT